MCPEKPGKLAGGQLGRQSLAPLPGVSGWGLPGWPREVIPAMHSATWRLGAGVGWDGVGVGVGRESQVSLEVGLHHIPRNVPSSGPPNYFR